MISNGLPTHKLKNEDSSYKQNRIDKLNDWASVEVDAVFTDLDKRALILSLYNKMITSDFHMDNHDTVDSILGSLNKLVRGLPLSPIHDDKRLWIRKPAIGVNIVASYEHAQYSYLSKNISSDGIIMYRDANSVECYTRNISLGHVPFTCRLGEMIVHEMFPITFPYEPSIDKYSVHMERYKTTHGDKEYTYIYVHHIVDPSGNRFSVDRLFTNYGVDDTTIYGMAEVNKLAVNSMLQYLQVEEHLSK